MYKIKYSKVKLIQVQINENNTTLEQMKSRLNQIIIKTM